MRSTHQWPQRQRLSEATSQIQGVVKIYRKILLNLRGETKDRCVRHLRLLRCGVCVEFSRQEQLNLAVAALGRHADLGKLLLAATRTQSTQASHLQGLYGEVDKLTKGKSLMPTSDLLVDLVNSLISDAKELVYRDIYLSRLKTFVPAGNNPIYPDVLVALRILEQSLQRFNYLLEAETSKHADIGNELVTILSALQVADEDEHDFAENGEPGGGTEEASDDTQDEDTDTEEEADDQSEEEDDGQEEDAEYAADDDSEDVEQYEEYVRKQDVRRKLAGKALSDVWFVKHNDDMLFNFAMLDRLGLPKYEPPSEGITFIKSGE